MKVCHQPTGVYLTPQWCITTLLFTSTKEGMFQSAFVWLAFGGDMGHNTLGLGLQLPWCFSASHFYYRPIVHWWMKAKNKLMKCSIAQFTSRRPLEQAKDNAVSLFLSETLSISALFCSSTSHTSTCPAALARINGVNPTHQVQANCSICIFSKTYWGQINKPTDTVMDKLLYHNTNIIIHLQHTVIQEKCTKEHRKT